MTEVTPHMEDAGLSSGAYTVHRCRGHAQSLCTGIGCTSTMFVCDQLAFPLSATSSYL